MFFDECNGGKDWDACKHYCHKDASFETEAETLAAIATFDTYCDRMKDALTMFDETVEVEVKAEAHDETKDNVLVYAEIRGNIIIGPEPMYAKTNYVYVMHFDEGKIRHM